MTEDNTNFFFRGLLFNPTQRPDDPPNRTFAETMTWGG